MLTGFHFCSISPNILPSYERGSFISSVPMRKSAVDTLSCPIRAGIITPHWAINCKLRDNPRATPAAKGVSCKSADHLSHGIHVRFQCMKCKKKEKRKGLELEMTGEGRLGEAAYHQSCSDSMGLTEEEKLRMGT